MEGTHEVLSSSLPHQDRLVRLAGGSAPPRGLDSLLRPLMARLCRFSPPPHLDHGGQVWIPARWVEWTPVTLA